MAWEITGPEDGAFVIKLGKSICSERDMFCRETGRTLAKHRLDHPDKEPKWLDLHLAHHEMHGEIKTRNTLNEDIHKTIETWAMGGI